ncbi:hypothetical protein VIGAN_07156700, partial [Vigna angularis var. angularis]
TTLHYMEITLRATGRGSLSQPVTSLDSGTPSFTVCFPLIFLEVHSFICSSQLPHVFGLPSSSIYALSVVFLGDSECVGCFHGNVQNFFILPGHTTMKRVSTFMKIRESCTPFPTCIPMPNKQIISI